MAKKAFAKVNKYVAIATVATLLLGTGISYVPAFGAAKANVTVTSSASVLRNVMYYGDWSIWGGQGNFYPKDIPADQLTHLNFAFVDFNSSGELQFCDKDAAVGAPVGQTGVQWDAPNAGLIQAFKDLRAKNPNLKIGVSLGGWSKSGDFSKMAANPTSRKNFVNNVLKFIKYAEMDFVDLDWEYPASVRQPDFCDNRNDEGTVSSMPEDKANYVTLLNDFRAALDEQGKKIGKKYELSVALPAPIARLDEGIDIAGVFNAVDFANIMTYDMRGAWDDGSGHQSGLYTNPNDPHKGKGLSVDESVQYLIKNGAAPQKIVVGAAYYSRGWEKVSNDGPDKGLPGLFGNAAIATAKDADGKETRGADNEAPIKDGEGGRRGGVYAYRSFDTVLKSEYSGLKEYWDDYAKAPYMYNESTGAFFTYDNARSIQEKCKYVKENNLGGMIAWMASEDKPTNSSKRDELTKVTKQALFGSADLAKQDIIYDKLDVTISMTPYKEQWGSNQGYKVTVKNNERSEESGIVLSSLESGHEAIKSPKLVFKTSETMSAGDYLAGKVSKDGEYTVFDLSQSYEGQLIKQGGSYSFLIKTTEAPTDLSKIQAVYLAQSIAPGGTELGRQLLYGVDDPTNNTKPTFIGVNDALLTVGDSFNPMAGISAIDKEDGDLTSSIKVSGSVDTSRVGEYALTYSVTDKGGLTSTATRKITVKAVPVNTAPEIIGANDISIIIGSSFDPMAGITAKDAEDGILTSSIKVNGTVDTNKEGKYTLTYLVTDKGNLTTSATRVITVTPRPANTAPLITGVSNLKIVEGTAFDPMNGVKANDAEDGDLTSQIKVSGSVDINKVGEYKLVYTVTDKGGLVATAERIVSVEAKPAADEFNPSKTYVKGDRVTYKGVEYVCKYWTQGASPEISDAWERVVVTYPDGSTDYISGKTYTAGELVRLEGKVYKSNWWTNTKPGSDSSWSYVKDI